MKFYRYLINARLEKERHQLVFNRKPVKISEHIRIHNMEDAFEVSFRHPEYTLTDKKSNQSFFRLAENQKVILDKYGNCLSTRSIQFEGFLGRLHLSGMLPLNYTP